MAAFTLIELLAVMAIMASLMAGSLVALQAVQGGQRLSSATANVAATLELARAYAMANNTYVFVGFFESDVSCPTSTRPAPAGAGRVWLGVVASKDGTRLYDASNFSPANLLPIGKLEYFDNVHMVTAAPSNVSNLDSTAVQVLGSSPIIAFGAPLTSGSMINQFNTFIQFDPRGSATLPTSNTPPLASWIQINLVPAHGNQTGDSAVLQLDGITGDVRIFRP